MVLSRFTLAEAANGIRFQRAGRFRLKTQVNKQINLPNAGILQIRLNRPAVVCAAPKQDGGMPVLRSHHCWTAAVAQHGDFY